MMKSPAVGVMVRLPPALHERARRRAFRDRSSLNRLVVAALTAYLRPARKGGTR
jgi:predicted HicB family RNase H-like nuclease